MSQDSQHIESLCWPDSANESLSGNVVGSMRDDSWLAPFPLGADYQIGADDLFLVAIDVQDC